MVTVKVTWWVPVSSWGITRWLGRGLADASAMFPSGVKDAFDRNEATSDPASTDSPFTGCLINVDPDWSSYAGEMPPDLTSDWPLNSIFGNGYYFKHLHRSFTSHCHQPASVPSNNKQNTKMQHCCNILLLSVYAIAVVKNNFIFIRKSLTIHVHSSLYIKCVRCAYIRSSVTLDVASSVANDITMRMT